ncbi:Kelch-like protein [Actinidia chinensis var. chinensis]|uniref:Kelch-like protein n=1 Tax=Actinidia chinensis var. chinensis TaxID=1590841 RepID=A0A2R6RTC3_ACTCC|nr:Kelch-like protein [Actinidia chinensis var. chinensis]
MGAGRKKKTLSLKEKPQPSCTINCSAPARNLRKRDLGAVIFGCKHNTIRECCSELLFGLPAPHFAYVKNISPGLPLFLFNYSDRKLYGIFEAVSPGQMSIDPYGWTTDVQQSTPYPAQVRVRIQMQCQPLLEDQFRPVIADNYYERRLFWFELDQAQTRNLISLFSLSPIDASASVPQNTTRRNMLINALPTSDAIKVIDDVEATFSQAGSAHLNQCNVQWGPKAEKCEKELVQPMPNYACTSSSDIISTNASHPQTTWSSLFKTLTISDKLKEDEDLKAQASEVNFPHSYQYNTEWKSSTLAPCMEGESRNFEAHPEDSAMGEYEEVHADPKSEWELSYPSFQQMNSFEAPNVDTREEGEHFEAVASDENLTHSNKSNIGWCSSFATPHLHGESHHSQASTDDDVSKIYEEAVSHSDTNCEHSYLSTDNHEKLTVHPFVMAEVHSEDGCSSETLAVAEMKSSNFHSVVAKLVQGIERLKASELEQIQKIASLEQELVESKVEIQQLKNRCHLLESRSLSSIGHVQEAVLKTCDELRPKNDSILIVGGFDGSSWLSALDSYSPLLDTMKSLKPMTSVRSYASAATLNGELYIFGGVDGDTWHDTVESYNPMSDQWVRRPSLNQKKGNLAGASLYGKIFAVGGGNGVECYSEVEMLDINIGRWITTRSMLQKRFAPAAAEINSALYVVGGYDGRNYLNTVERFDPREHTWTRLGSMSTRRGCHSLTVLNEKLYALGGYDGSKMVSTVEIFDPRLGSWMMGEPMNNSRGYSGAVVIGEKIYIIGGVKESDDILGTIECYKGGCGWELTKLEAVGKRCFFSAIVL